MAHIRARSVRAHTTAIKYFLLQQIWATTALIGCGYASCPGVEPYSSYTLTNMYACNYTWGWVSSLFLVFVVVDEIQLYDTNKVIPIPIAYLAPAICPLSGRGICICTHPVHQYGKVGIPQPTPHQRGDVCTLKGKNGRGRGFQGPFAHARVNDVVVRLA